MSVYNLIRLVYIVYVCSKYCPSLKQAYNKKYEIIKESEVYMDGLGIIGWIVLGGLAGWVASMIAGTSGRQGLLGNIVAGILGAFVGGFILNVFGGVGVTGFNFWSFLVALLGAVVVLSIWRAIRGGRKSN